MFRRLCGLACALSLVGSGAIAVGQQIAGSIGGGEFFNVLNHTNFLLPVSDIEAPVGVFGSIQSDVSPRVIQVALKFLF